MEITQTQQFDNHLMIGYPPMNNLGGLCMKGRVHQKKDKGRKKPSFYIDFRPTIPNKIYSDENGQSFYSKVHAERTLNVIRYEIDQGIFDPAKYVKKDLIKLKFCYRFELFLTRKEKALQKKDLSPSYLKALKGYYKNHYKDFFKTFDIRKIKTHHISLFHDKLESLAPKTRSNILNALDHFFNTEIEDETILRKPKFPSISVTQPVIEWVDREDQEKIFKCIPEKHQPIYRFGAMFGMRPSEIRALQWKDINFDSKTPYFTIRRNFSDGELREITKTKIKNEIPLTRSAIDLLKSIKPDIHSSSDFVFRGVRKKYYSDTTLRRVWIEARKKAGFTVKLYGGIRHSFASQRHNRGVDLRLIGAVMGHKDLRTTDKYAHANLDGKLRAIEPEEWPQNGPRGGNPKIMPLKRNEL